MDDGTVLRVGGNGLRIHDFYADAAARFDLRKGELTDVKALNGRQVAERPQEILAAPPFHDPAEVVLKRLDALHEGDPERIRDPGALRTELILDQLLGIAGEPLIADDHAFCGLDA